MAAAAPALATFLAGAAVSGITAALVAQLAVNLVLTGQSFVDADGEVWIAEECE